MILFAAALAVAGSLHAMGLPDTVTVRFATPVVIGSQTLPAGTATIHILRGAGSVVLSIASESGKTSSVFVNRLDEAAPETNGQADVVLERHGSDLRLERLWLPDHTGFEVLQAGE
jgi:hypothetical protein